MQNMQQFLDLLGYRAKDKVTGFSGIITSICFDLYGCIQACISQGVDDKGQIPERANNWFDTNRIEICRAAGRAMQFEPGERYVDSNPSPCESRPY